MRRLPSCTGCIVRPSLGPYEMFSRFCHALYSLPLSRTLQVVMLNEAYSTAHQLSGLSAPERTSPSIDLQELPRHVSRYMKKSTLQVLCEDCVISQVTSSFLRITCSAEERRGKGA